MRFLMGALCATLLASGISGCATKSSDSEYASFEMEDVQALTDSTTSQTLAPLPEETPAKP